MAERDQDYYDYYLDPAMWPEFMRSGLMPTPPSAPMLAPDSSAMDASSPLDEAGEAQAARSAAARRQGQWQRRGTQEYEQPGPMPSPDRDAEIPYFNRMTGAEPYLKRPDGSIVLNPAAWAPALGRDPSGRVYLNPDAWGQTAVQAQDILGFPTRNLRGMLYGEPAPPPPRLPDMPQKIPSRDPRAQDADAELANIGLHTAIALMPELASLRFPTMMGLGPRLRPASGPAPEILARTGRQTDIDGAAAIAHVLHSPLGEILIEHPSVPGRVIKDTFVVKNPNQYRSGFAEFEPAKRNSADLSAAIAGVGILGPYFAGSALPVRK